MQINQSRLQVAEAARTHVFYGGYRLGVRRRTLEEQGCVAQMLEFNLARGRPVTLEKLVALYTSRDHAITECSAEARKAVQRAGRVEDLLQSHRLAGERLWSACDITLEHDQRTQGLLRLHLFHLLQTGSLHAIDLDVRVPSRG